MDDGDDLPTEECWEDLLDKAGELVGVADDYSFGCIVLAWQKPGPGQDELVTVRSSELSPDERNRVVTQVAMGLDPNVGRAVREAIARDLKR